MVCLAVAEGALLPANSHERALARSLCAELHSGFPALRSRCPNFSEGTGLLRETEEISRELNRLDAIFSRAQLPFMFARPGIVDAFMPLWPVALPAMIFACLEKPVNTSKA